MEHFTDDQNEYARNGKGEIKFILEVERGTKGFTCLGCNEAMHPVRRTIEHYKSYFRHEAKDVAVERKCTFSSEQARRILAMDILSRTKRIKVPNLYKYSPDSTSKILIREASYIEASSVKGNITFYHDTEGVLRWGRSPDADQSAILQQADIVFFNIHEEPVLIIRFSEKNKAIEKEKLKIRELGIDTIQIILPKDTPENIARALEITQYTKWVYNHVEQSTNYAQLQQRNREGVSASDAIEMGFFQETFACRESQINNLVRKITRYLESQHYRETERQLRKELSGIASDTVRDITELDDLRSSYRAGVEARYSGEIETIESGEREFRFSFGATQEQVRATEEDLERRYIAKRKGIIDRRSEVEKLIREYDDVERSAAEIGREQDRIDNEIQSTERRVAEIIRNRESVSERFSDLTEQEQSRAERERQHLAAEEDRIPEDIEEGRRAQSAAFERDREGAIKAVKDRDCSGVTELSGGIKRILDQRRIILDWDEVQEPYNRNRKAYDCFIDRTYKKWFDS